MAIFSLINNHNLVNNWFHNIYNHLFEQLERLNDEELTDEELEKEIKRTDAMKDIATQIIANANIVLKATELNMEYSRNEVNVPQMLIGFDEKK